MRGEELKKEEEDEVVVVVEESVVLSWVLLLLIQAAATGEMREGEVVPVGEKKMREARREGERVRGGGGKEEEEEDDGRSSRSPREDVSRWSMPNFNKQNIHT